MKATDLKNNKRVIIPALEEDDTEIKNNHLKVELKDVFVIYMNENCDNSGNILENNMSDKQQKSIKTLKKKISEEKLVCCKPCFRYH